MSTEGVTSSHEAEVTQLEDLQLEENERKTVIFVLKTVIFASSQGHHLLTLKLEAFLCSFVPQQLKHRNCCIKSIIQGIKIIRTTLKKRFVFHFHKTKMSV